MSRSAASLRRDDSSAATDALSVSEAAAHSHRVPSLVSSRTGAAEPVESWASARAFLQAQLRRGPFESWRVVTVPVPAAPLWSLMGVDAATPAALWDAPSGQRFATWGTAARLSASGNGRFGLIRRQASELFDRLGKPSLPLVGGFAFAPSSAKGVWNEFGDATFTLPRWHYAVDGIQGRLTAAAAPGEPVQPFVGELERIQRCLTASSSQAPGSSGSHGESQKDRPGNVGTVHQVSRRTWARWVADALRAIHQGEFEKLVLARVARVTRRQPFDLLALVAALEGRDADGTCFAFREPDSAFVGLTPERLVHVRARTVSTEALAGTVSASVGAGTLLRSEKDRREQRAVTDDIVRRLAPFCESLHAESAPVPRMTGALIHLRTPIEGRLKKGLHLLEVAEALHPTPAVAGLPAMEATAWLAKREAEQRGWYAGLVGWFDARGDGDLAVAIRSAFISGRTARVYSGCGIVPGSEAASEYLETDLKQRGMLRALGAA